MALLGDASSRRFPKVPLASMTQGFDGFAFSVWAWLHVKGKVPDAVAEVLNQHANTPTRQHANTTLTEPEVRAAIEPSRGRSCRRR